MSLLTHPAPSTDLQQPALGGRERRRSHRAPHVVEAWISSPTALKPEDGREATSLNISRHGVAFRMRVPMPLNTFHVIEIGHGEQRLVSEIRIVSCVDLGQGEFEYGAEFC